MNKQKTGLSAATAAGPKSPIGERQPTICAACDAVLTSGTGKRERRDMDIDTENELRPFKQQICLLSSFHIHLAK